MQPHRRGDEAESKASCSVDKGPGKGAGGEQCKIEGLKLAHGIPQLSPPRLAWREMGQRLACYSSGVVAWTCLYLWIRGREFQPELGGICIASLPPVAAARIFKVLLKLR